MSQGFGTPPQTPGGDALSNLVNASTDTTAAAGDVVFVDTTSGPVTITLPTTPAALSQVVVKKVNDDSGASAVTVVAHGSGLIDRASDYVITDFNGSATFQNLAADTWKVISEVGPLSAQSGSALYIQATQPDDPVTPSLWIPIDEDGNPADVSEWQVFTDSPPVAPNFTVDPAITGTGVVGATLTCDGGTVSGSPTPTKTYQWQRDGVDRSSETASTYVVVSGDIGHDLTCDVTADNDVEPNDTATSNAITGLAAPTAPGAPTGLSLTPGDTTIDASWTAPASNGGSAITTYLVEYRTPNGSGSFTTFTHSASTTPSITITGLTNDSAYGVRVSAVNAIGTGTATSEGTATPVAAAGFDPTDYGTVLAHWIGDDVAGADAAAVAAWNDASAAGRNMAQATSGLRPTKRTNVLNSHAVVRFDGVDDVLTYTRMTTIRSVFIVCKKTGAYDKEGPILGDATTYDFIGPASIGLLNPGFASADILDGAGYRDGVSTAPNLIECPATEFHLYELITLAGVHSDQLGLDRAAGNGNWRGDYAEILIYSDALGTTNREAVEDYLMTKYGL